ncbi:MAG: class I SAM-dependent methyltransferase [Pirellula sp.]
MHFLKSAGLSHAYKIPTFTSKDELATLLNLALGVPNGGAAIEIGSYLGASTCYIAAGIRTRAGQLICVDTWQNETMPEGLLNTMELFEKNVAPVRDCLKLIRVDSTKLNLNEVGQQFHLAFIDGDHSYDSAKADFATVSPWISDNGVVAFHDFSSFQGVSKVVGEVLSTGMWRLEGAVSNLLWIRKTKFAHSS